jgi:quercetin dioxygenase-like cupin family protein
MFCGICCTVAAVFLIANAAIAQDPTRVEPKHYKLQFENDRVQVVSVHYGPHERSEMHYHPSGVVVVITGGHLRFTDQNGKVTEVLSKPGESRWFPPFQHKVENIGNEPYNAVYIGMKNKGAEAGLKPTQNSPFTADEVAKILLEYAAAMALPAGTHEIAP